MGEKPISPEQSPRDDLSKPVNLLERDNDPRKTAYAVHLAVTAREYWHQLTGKNGERYSPSIFRLHQAEGLLEKKPDKTRKHMAPEHMITVMSGCKALGRLLNLPEADCQDLVLIGGLHDVNKDIEFRMVRATIEDPKAGYGQLGHDLSGTVSAQKLRFAGVPERIINIHDKSGHASCPEIEALLQKKGDNKDLTKDEIKLLVFHYIDDVVTNPNIIDPQITSGEQGDRLNALDRRCIQNEKNSTYTKYNEAWRNDPRNRTGETAFQMQRRVGHLVETRLAQMIKLDDPLRLPELIYQQMQKDVQANWERKQKPPLSNQGN
ncbi:MAG: hypothetical protein HYV42_04845 [Candidatus Magasanikbacteria bacterium]|nr:hypothetical protein [Candidatus Magasanikbacteria bacterium]